MSQSLMYTDGFKMSMVPIRGNRITTPSSPRQKNIMICKSATVDVGRDEQKTHGVRSLSTAHITFHTFQSATVLFCRVTPA